MCHWKRSSKKLVVLVSSMALLSVAACGGDDGDGPGTGASAGSAGSGGATASGGSVTGTVSYAGTKEGDLILAAFAEWPAAGPPEVFLKIPAPSFPQAYTIEDLSPGDYFIFAFLDVAPASPTMPGSEDVQSTPTDKVHVSDEATAVMDVALPSD